jgi:hypothetical protein
LFTDYELSHNQPTAGQFDIDNSKLYSRIVPEVSANSTNESVLLAGTLPKQDPLLEEAYSNVGSKEDNVSPLQSRSDLQDTDIPIAATPKQYNLQTSVPSVKDVKSTKMKQMVGVRF